MSSLRSSNPDPFRVLVVDDEEPIREIIQQVLAGLGHHIDTAANCDEARTFLENKDYDVLVSDIMMPGETGIDLLNDLQKTNPDLPVVLMTGNPSIETASEAVRTQVVVDYLSKPISASQIIHTVERAVKNKRMRDENQRLAAENEAYRLHLERLVEEKSAELVQANADLRTSYNFTLEALVAMLDAREHMTGKHSLRVRDLSLMLGRAIGLSEEDLEHLARGTLLHDLGKISIPDTILLKPAKLTDEEWSVMKMHVQAGYNIVRNSKYLAPAAKLILHHHEKFDGSGYPSGLKGEEICLGARIFAVIDTYDALRSVRLYQGSVSKEASIAEIKRCSGSHFDPDVVDAFLTVVDDIEAVAGWNA